MPGERKAPDDFLVRHLRLLQPSLAAVDDRHPAIGVIDRVAARVGLDEFLERLLRGRKVLEHYPLRIELFRQRIIQQL